MHLRLLTTLFALTVCKGVVTSSTVEPASPPTDAEHHTASVTTTTADVASPSVKTTDAKQPHNTAPTQITAQVTSHRGSTSAPPSTPRPTRNTSPEPESGTTPQTTTTNQTFTHNPTLPTTSSNTSTTTVNTTSTALSPEWSQGDLAANPGLVAILCIFCIVLALVLVVATVKCIRSPRSNFERLDDVPMSKVNEESPFAQHSR